MVDLLKTHNYGNGPFPDISEEIFAEIGCRLILLQDLELQIAFVVKVAFEENPIKARDAILNADNKTMGQLLGVLRKKVNVDADFDQTLKRTLRARNEFVHEFSHMFNLRCEEGVEKAVKYLLKSMDDLEEVSNVMKAVIVAYGRDRGISDRDLEENWRQFGDLDELESRYIPKISESFGLNKG
ncbi:hypothetical protein [Motiliproteus sp. MSK22-1]|uniref:hypothetical protein n=1 Tax=Motiliproteus sp. MSK22-1 TaxID=1897630 RepID=UPI00097609B8|nr:hypothetical protein [Motiliproteus sp. MSK22-1]OMH31954.1 hypothetical protein BGP75_16055 [Motiliproteus sp. MSK22-1]